MNRPSRSAADVVKFVGLLLGPVAFLVPLLWPVLPSLEGPARAAAATTAWMAIWWITEAIPIPATALLPIVLFPATGVVPAGQVTLQYGNQLIFLFLGGFLLSGAIQKWDLHRRIALRIILAVGLSPGRIILGFMAATAFLSMWISNTATALMMVPIGLAVVHQLVAFMKEQRLPIDTRPEHFHFGIALMLGIAYAASIGGLGTLIGSPPNAIFAGFAETALGRPVGFLQWLYFGLPLSVVGLITAWLYLTRRAFPLQGDGLEGAVEVLRQQHRALGPMGPAEKRVTAIFAFMAGMWIVRGLLEDALGGIGLGGITDTTVAVAGALLLFITNPGQDAVSAPSTDPDGEVRRPTSSSASSPTSEAAASKGHRGLIGWEDAQSVPWGILLLFGGGLALAHGIETSGAALWLAGRLAVLQGMPPVLVVLTVTAIVLALTEVSSNTATATIFMPVMMGLGDALGVHPQVLMVAAATAASCAFMLPVATPPNAVVFGSGYVDSKHMLKAGLGLNVIFVLLIAAATHWWLPVAWGLAGAP